MKRLFHLIDVLLTSQQKKKLILLLAMVLAGAVLELLGLGLIIPLMVAIIDPAFTENYPAILPLVGYFTEPTYENIVLLAICILVIFYFLKTGYLVLLAYRQGVVLYGIKEEIGRRLFTGYMHSPYVFYLTRNTAQLIRNITAEIDNLGTVSRAVTTLIVEGIVSLAVLFLLVYIEPAGTLMIALVLLLASYIFQHFTKGPLNKFGKSRQFHNGLRLQYLQQGFSGVKDVKVLGRESVFIDLFNAQNKAGTAAERFQYTLASMPRLYLELVVLLGLVALVLVRMIGGLNNEPIALVLGIYAVSIFRLLPSINRMIAGAQQIRFCLPSVLVIADELASHSEGNRPPEKYGKTSTLIPNLSGRIGVKNLSFKHVGSDKYILRGVTLNIKVGELVGIVGESGAGKSTLIDLMLGLLDPTEGSIGIDGVDIVGDVRGWQQQVGYVPQHIYLTDDSVRKNIAFGISEENINDAEVSRAVNAAQLDGLVHEMPGKLETVIGEHGMRLSGGQRQRIGIARALYHNPNVLILDEATSALDEETESEIMSTIESLHGQKTIIIVTHRVKTLSGCDTIYSFTDGKLVGSGSYQELIKSKKV